MKNLNFVTIFNTATTVGVDKKITFQNNNSIQCKTYIKNSPIPSQKYNVY